jgi:methionyl-tRNA formyltransferase
MKLAFAGTPEFAAAALDALHRAGHEIGLVLTQPDRPAGRGLQSSASAVKALASRLGLPVRQPHTLKDPEMVHALQTLAPEAMIVAAYGLIVPPALLELPPRGCINIHASLLPRWRGAAPIQRAILAGDDTTGISIMQMDAGLDTGPVLLDEAMPIAPDDTAKTLHDRLAALGARLIVSALESPLREPRPQDPSRATYAAKVSKSEAALDWNDSAENLDRKIRAFNPVPGASTQLGANALKVWRARIAAASEDAIPGTVIGSSAHGITVACGGATALELVELQRAGGKRLSAAAFLAGCPVPPGARLGA